MRQGVADMGRAGSSSSSSAYPCGVSDRGGQADGAVGHGLGGGQGDGALGRLALADRARHLHDNNNRSSSSRVSQASQTATQELSVCPSLPARRPWLLARAAGCRHAPGPALEP